MKDDDVDDVGQKLRTYVCSNERVERPIKCGGSLNLSSTRERERDSTTWDKKRSVSRFPWYGVEWIGHSVLYTFPVIHTTRQREGKKTMK